MGVWISLRAFQLIPQDPKINDQVSFRDPKIKSYLSETFQILVTSSISLNVYMYL